MGIFDLFKKGLWKPEKDGSIIDQEVFKAGQSEEQIEAPIHPSDLVSAARGGNIETVNMLLAKGLDVNVKDGKGYPIIILAAMNGHTETVKVLLDKGANINARGDHNSTALMLSAMGGHDETVKLLIDRGSDINAREDMGWSALIVATIQGRNKTVRLLLDGGADMDVKDNRGNTAIYYASRDYALSNGHNETYELLRDRGYAAPATNLFEPAHASGENDKESNLQRWQTSGAPKEWVEEHRYLWNHQNWLSLIEALRKSPYWPLDPDKVGAVLEEIRVKGRTANC
ncbi:MAG TPA: ankyrin repeat domain-containing protein [Syntrophorhabdaceae bacterium]|nr:ankyrin repeat domain-containing protein [Syntrophorhabdaceae bacterium]